MPRFALFALSTLAMLAFAAPKAALASPILSLMSEKGVSIIEKISITPGSSSTGSLGDDDLQVVFGTDDLSDYKQLKKLVKNKFAKFQDKKRAGKSTKRLRLKMDGSGLDLKGKLKGAELRRLAKELKAMKGSFIVEPTGIPEPGNLLLMGSGLLGLLAVNRRLSARD
jgi:hypothetical protein